MNIWRSESWLLAIAIACNALDAHADPEAVTIWFRGSEGCPEAPSFIARLEARSARARLASPGDRVEFVVTLGPSSGEFHGRLERQTAGGTIAMRELTGESCEKLADGLALTLVLALDPEAQDSAAPGRGTAAPEPARERAQITGPAGAVPTAGAAPPVFDQPPDAAARPRVSPRTWRWALVAQGTLSYGVAPEPAPGVAAFVEYALESPRLFAPALRVGIAGAQASNHSEFGSLHFSVWAARLEACPLECAASLTSGETARSVTPCRSASGSTRSLHGTATFSTRCNSRHAVHSMRTLRPTIAARQSAFRRIPAPREGGLFGLRGKGGPYSAA